MQQRGVQKDQSWKKPPGLRRVWGWRCEKGWKYSANFAKSKASKFQVLTRSDQFAYYILRPDPACCPEVETGWRILIPDEDKFILNNPCLVLFRERERELRILIPHEDNLMSTYHQHAFQWGWRVLNPYEGELILRTHSTYCSEGVAGFDPLWR